MKNNNFLKALLVILAVVSIGLAALYADITINGTDSPSGELSDGIADYGSADTAGDSYAGTGTVTEVSGSDGIYTVTDDGTVEMDSIPNDAGSGTPSDSDA